VSLSVQQHTCAEPAAGQASPGGRNWIALVGPEEEENLSLRYLAAALEAAMFHAELVPFNAASELADVLAAIVSGTPPRLVAISLAFQWRARDFLALAIALRQRGYHGHITAGGHFGTFACRELLRDFPELDSICCYEAERTLVALTRAIESGADLASVAGLALRDARGEVVLTGAPAPADVGTLPWPDRRGGPAVCLGHRMAPLVGSRGCYANCAFCCIAAWHALARPAARFRLRPVADVADEVAWLHRRRGIDIFIFHDDNFFVPGRQPNLERIHALGDALAARGIGRIATVVKARPTDVTHDVFQALRDRLGCIRVFLGVESAAAQGLRTLRRGVHRAQNDAALRTLAQLELYVCFNMLIFDPDTTLASLAENLAFMEAHADRPWNFGRVELYAGTPLLARLQAEGRCTGDYLGWNYRLASPAVQRVFELATVCFYRRNFASGALANRLQATRFDVEVCRHFHGRAYRPAWLREAQALSRQLGQDSVAALRAIVAHVRAGAPGPRREFVANLSARLRAVEADIGAQAHDLEQRIRATVGQPCQHIRSREIIVAGAARHAPQEVDS
jgi:anaerobic magnesium-protoporphyrin IX monomethyl ester cyclase